MSKPRTSPLEGIHHVILKGIDRSEVFHSSEDKDYFLSVMRRYSEKLSVSVSSYALMDNHIHMSVKVEGKYPVGEFVKRLCISYVQHYFNPKYDRQGALFQSKFFSRPVKDDDEFITLVKYILLNPMKGGLSKSLEYEYSSYAATLYSYENGSELKRNGSALISSSEIKARIPDKEHFAEFIADNSLVSFYEEPFGLKEYEIREYISEEVGKRNGSAYEKNGSYALLRSMDRLILREMFNTLISKRVSIAKLSRITGLSRYFIKMALI